MCIRDSRKYVHSEEDKFRQSNNLSGGIEVGQFGPDTRGGAGPGPLTTPTSTTNREEWQELIPEGPPGLLEILTTFGEPRVSD